MAEGDEPEREPDQPSADNEEPPPKKYDPSDSQFPQHPDAFEEPPGSGLWHLPNPDAHLPPTRNKRLAPTRTEALQRMLHEAALEGRIDDVKELLSGKMYYEI